jgi:hypothetical protein
MLPAEDNNGSVFQVMLRGAPLHPRVLEQVEASTQFWNPPASDPRVSLAAQHARALMSFWKSGDAAYRARALPWLQRHPAAGAFAAEAALSDSDAEARLTPLEFLELIELLPCSESYTQATRWLRDPDLAVRRAALRAFVASRVPHEPFASQFLRSLLLASPWEEVFGPLDGLPTFCAEFARGLPTFDGRVAALRRLAVANPGDAFEAILGDMAAARRLLPELRQMLDPRQLGECSAVLRCLRHLGTDAAELLPAVEVLGEVPFLHFDVKATAAILRGESPAEPVPDWISQGGAPTDWVYAVDYR